MSFLDRLFPKSSTSRPNWVEQDDNGYFYFNSELSDFLGGNMKKNEVPDFNPKKAMMYATSLAEIGIPIDIIAGGVALCDFDLVNNDDEVIENVPENLQRLMAKPNPFIHFKELVYQIVFSELATGGSYTLTKMPSSYKTKFYDRITNIWTLNPDKIRLVYNKEVILDPFMIKDVGELLSRYEYDFIHKDLEIKTSEVYFNSTNTVGNDLRPVSPLIGVERNINNLLQVYSARYNIYKNNGSAGILVKEQSTGNNIVEQTDPTTRQDIMDDLQKRDGLTGDKNLIGISSIPVKYIETLAKIKDLEPFKETYADAITIAGKFKIDKELIPKEGSTTFSNKEAVEIALWQNTIMPIAKDVAKTLTNVYYLPEGMRFKANFDDIQILQTDRKVSSEADKIELENIMKMRELGLTIPENYKKWEA